MSYRVHLDRLDKDRAILVCGTEGAETISIPARLLPTGSAEGDALDLTLEPSKNDPTKEEVQGLMEDLFGDTGKS